jgi:hypothetical protein
MLENNLHFKIRYIPSYHLKLYLFLYEMSFVFLGRGAKKEKVKR